MNSKVFLSAVLGVVVGYVLAGFLGSEAVPEAMADIEVPEAAVELSKCVPQMGYHYADPETLPRGPIFLRDGDGAVVGIEYLLLEEELEGSEGAGQEVMLDAFETGFTNVSLTYEPNGVGDLPMPLYALHLYKDGEAARTGICDGEELEPDHHDEAGDVPTSADNAPEGSLHNLPVPDAVAAVRTRASEQYEAPEGEVIVMSAVETTWPNGCLGLPAEGEFCTQALVPGYEVTVMVNGAEYTYRTNDDGSVIREE